MAWSNEWISPHTCRPLNVSCLEREGGCVSAVGEWVTEVAGSSGKSTGDVDRILSEINEGLGIMLERFVECVKL